MDNTSVMKQIYQFYLNHKYDIKRHRKLNFFINIPSAICIIIIILAQLLINNTTNHALKNCFIQLSNIAFLSFLPICIARCIIVYIQEHLQLKIAMQEIHKNLSSPIVRNSSMRIYLTLYAMNKIEETKSLTQTMNSTKTESEFFNCYDKVIEILTELKKYERLGIYTTALPSVEIERFENEKHLYIESLNERILKSQNMQPQKSYDNMTGYEFEHFCAELLRKNNFKNVEVTQISGDHGIDILAEKDDISYAIQCKCYSSNIGNAAIQQAHTGKTLYNKDIAVVLTNQYFTQQAINEANALGVKLWDRDKLNQMIAN